LYQATIYTPFIERDKSLKIQKILQGLFLRRDNPLLETFQCQKFISKLLSMNLNPGAALESRTSVITAVLTRAERRAFIS